MIDWHVVGLLLLALVVGLAVGIAAVQLDRASASLAASDGEGIE